MQETVTKRESSGADQSGAWPARLLREPLLHFAVLGSLLFAGAHYWDDGSRAPDDSSIIVREGKVRSLAQIFQRTWQRPPTQQELDGLIQDYVDEEVFYREALAMGLDQDDTLIRRRLRQKLEFVAEDLTDAVEPTDDELEKFLAENTGRFRLEDRTTFTQIYFSPQRRGESLAGDLDHALQAVRAGTTDVAEVGDPILLPMFHENLRDSDIANLVGRRFSEDLKQVETGEWAGPIESSYGVHLVKVHERTPGRLPDLEEVREAVRREWFAERRAKSKQQFYDSLRERYEVTIEMPSTDQPADSSLNDRETAETDSP